MRILMVSSEVETFARSGGLGDVVLSLSRALAQLGHEVCVVTPLYGTTSLNRPHHYWYGTVPVRVIALLVVLDQPEVQTQLAHGAGHVGLLVSLGG